MGNITVCRYKKWNDFKASIIPELYTGEVFVENKFLFRGQGSADWKLATSFDRWIELLGLKDIASENIDRENELLEYFREECEKLSVSRSILEDKVRLRSIGQHFGLPTRMLDWSRSPYVAAFFAFSEAATLNVEELGFQDVAVWALRRGSEIFAPGADVEIHSVPPSENDRMVNQAGLFTVSRSPYKCLDDYVNSCNPKERSLWRFTIPSTEAAAAIADLASMGLTHTRLYHDLGGCATAAKMRLAFAVRYPD